MNVGDPVTLTCGVNIPSGSPTYTWRYEDNNTILEDETSRTLDMIVDTDNLGNYSCEVTIGSVTARGYYTIELGGIKCMQLLGILALPCKHKLYIS